MVMSRLSRIGVGIARSFSRGIQLWRFLTFELGFFIIIVCSLLESALSTGRCITSVCRTVTVPRPYGQCLQRQVSVYILELFGKWSGLVQELYAEEV